MTPEDQRIAIAKACGWTRFTPDTIQFTARRGDGKWDLIPDYLNDLNAMHEAEKVLTWKQQVVYRTMLQKLCVTLTDAHMATAAQRAEAFLRVHNLWRE